MKKRFLAITLAATMVLGLGLTGCSSKSDSKTSSNKKVEYSANIPEKIAKDADGVKIMVIRKIGGDDHTAQFLAGAKKEGEAMGFTVDTFSANGDTAKFHDAISQAMDKGYDGVIISHGDDEATVNDVKKLVDKGIKVVTFDSNGGIATATTGVTMTAQDDAALAKLALDELNKVAGGKGNLAYLWVDGFPPMVARNKIYTEFLKTNTGYKEVDRFGVAAADTSVQTQNAVSAMLNKYPEGKLNTIFAAWDAFAVGAARAVKEAGRTDVKIVGIDVSNADLQLMQEENSPWVATAAVDPKLIGAVNLRLVAKKIAGEETPATHNLEASLITQEDLKKAGKAVNMETLSEVVPGWGQSDVFQEAWMTELKELFKK
jgi:simple sugar transport system substrate-binding protein